MRFLRSKSHIEVIDLCKCPGYLNCLAKQFPYEKSCLKADGSRFSMIVNGPLPAIAWLQGQMKATPKVPLHKNILKQSILISQGGPARVEALLLATRRASEEVSSLVAQQLQLTPESTALGPVHLAGADVAARQRIFGMARADVNALLSNPSLQPWELHQKLDEAKNELQQRLNTAGFFKFDVSAPLDLASDVKNKGPFFGSPRNLTGSACLQTFEQPGVLSANYCYPFGELHTTDGVP